MRVPIYLHVVKRERERDFDPCKTHVHFQKPSLGCWGRYSLQMQCLQWPCLTVSSRTIEQRTSRGTCCCLVRPCVSPASAPHSRDTTASTASLALLCWFPLTATPAMVDRHLNWKLPSAPRPLHQNLVEQHCLGQSMYTLKRSMILHRVPWRLLDYGTSMLAGVWKIASALFWPSAAKVSPCMFWTINVKQVETWNSSNIHFLKEWRQNAVKQWGKQFCCGPRFGLRDVQSRLALSSLRAWETLSLQRAKSQRTWDAMLLDCRRIMFRHDNDTFRPARAWTFLYVILLTLHHRRTGRATRALLALPHAAPTTPHSKSCSATQRFGQFGFVEYP